MALIDHCVPGVFFSVEEVLYGPHMVDRTENKLEGFGLSEWPVKVRPETCPKSIASPVEGYPTNHIEEACNERTFPGRWKWVPVPFIRSGAIRRLG